MNHLTTRAQAQDRRQRLLALLADGEFQSGEDLARRLRISRGGVWKLIRSLRALGIGVESLPRQGYRLPQPVNLLDRSLVLAAMSEDARTLVERLEVLLCVGSTNDHLAQTADCNEGCLQACLAEVQQAGRGRRGRGWIAPFGAGLCLSLGWRFPEAPPTFSALGLATAVAVVRALERCGAVGIGVKWPNDLLWQNRKLAGILIEMRGESGGPAHVVIGIGMNVSVPAAARLMVAGETPLPLSDLHEVLHERIPTRNELAGMVIEEMLRMLQVFSREGFAPFIAQWRALDMLANSPVKVISAAETILGTARGVESDGTLLVDVNGGIRRFTSGEVSLRLHQ